MKVTKKLRATILNAILHASHRAIDEHCEIDGPPDTWTDEQRRTFDLIADVEYRIIEAVKKELT